MWLFFNISILKIGKNDWENSCFFSYFEKKFAKFQKIPPKTKWPTPWHCPKYFKLKNDLSKTSCLHSKIQIKIEMLIELWASNYATYDGLFNGFDGVFQYVTQVNDNEPFIWISFNNPITTRKKLYN